MARQMRAIVLMWISNLCLSTMAADLTALRRDEANLHAVTFIDADRGWAVGEHGTVLHSHDGGLHWESQTAPTTATLSDLAMYNSQRGLAIGGSYQPYTQLSRGEVIITKDGGQSWQAVSGHDLPRLRKLIVAPGGKCVAIGDWSPVHLTSVFATTNGGQTWQPQDCEIAGALINIAGTVDDFLVLSDSGEVVRFQSQTKPQTLFPASNNRPDDYHWTALLGDGEKRLLIGSRGAISSGDQGDTWQTSQASLSDVVDSATSLLMWQDRLWIADKEDSVFSLTPDNPIVKIKHSGEATVRNLMRFSADRGWAVGDFGLVMGTRDGGQSWRVLRGGNRSPAVLMIGSNPASMSWSLLAMESLQHQRRVAIVLDSDRRAGTIQCQEQLADASALLGPATTFIHRADHKPKDTLQALRPAVVILDRSLTSVQRTAWSAAALETGVKRVLECGDHGTQTFNTAGPITATGMLASDVWFDAIAILSPGYIPPTKQMLSARFDTTSNSLAGEGLSSCTTNDARYCWSRDTNASRRHLQVLQARSAESNWIESLTASSVSLGEFQNQLNSVLPRMNAADRERTLARLATMTNLANRQSAYRATLSVMAANMSPNDKPNGVIDRDSALLARLRLDSIGSSREWEQAFGNLAIAGDLLPDQVAKDPTMTPVQLMVQLSPFQSLTQPSIGVGSSVQPAGFENGKGKSSAVQLASGETPVKTADVDLRWEFDPAVLMVRQAQEHQAVNHQRATELVPATTIEPTTTRAPTTARDVVKLKTPAETSLQRLAGLPAAGLWSALTSQSYHPQWLRCPVATVQPFLDGEFSEPWWSTSQSFTVLGGTANLQMAHDKHFVYLAINAPALDSSSQTGVRQRDTALDEVDHYRIRLDVDRDLMTSYEFEFDHLGNTRDSCDGFLAFNPRWFIACKHGDGRTHAEIAIQKADLGTDSAAVSTIWNVSCDRLRKTLPARGLAMPAADDWRPVLLE